MNKKIIVRSVSGALIIIFSSLFWLSLYGALNNGPDWLQKSLWSLAAFLFLGVSAGLAYLVEEKKALLYGLPFLVILPSIVFLNGSLAGSLVLMAAFLFLLLAAWRADFEKTLRIKLVSWIILKKGFGPLITALALITTLFFYFAPFTQSLGQKVFIPRPLFNAITQPMSEIALGLALPTGQDADKLSPELVHQQAELMDKLYLDANEELAAAGQTFKKWLPLGVSVSLFFTFKIIGTFLSFFMMALAWLVFRTLLLSGVVKIEKVAAEKEVVVLEETITKKQ